MKYLAPLTILLGVSLSYGDGELETDPHSEIEDSTESVSALDLFLDDFGFESMISVNELDESPLQLALRIKNYPMAAVLVENEVDDEILFTLAASRAGLFAIGIAEDEIPEIASVYGDVIIEEVDLSIEGMNSPAIEVTFPGESSAGLLIELQPVPPGNIYRIKVLSERFRTEHGIGVSSTVADVWYYYNFEEVYCGESGYPMIYCDYLKASMVLDPGDWWVSGEKLREPSAQSVLVEEILIL